MNVVFLSPSFPPTAAEFCLALKREGVKVLGIGDTPLAPETWERQGLAEYVDEPNMADPAALRAAMISLEQRHGKIDRIDSNGEHWLEAEGRLRDDFGVTGLGQSEVVRLRSKSEMAKIFHAAGIAAPPGIRGESAEEVRAFAARHGFPLVIKPDSGSGASDTWRVGDLGELEQALLRPLSDHIVQPFIVGDIVTYDGLCDRSGNIVFSTSHVYDTGIMQVRTGELDGHYYSERAIDRSLEVVGMKAVAAFDIRERFFHVEFFRTPSGEYVALEMNLRPPGGFTTDMMNAACDFDVYALWAKVLTGRDLSGFRYERKYHTAHAGRRDNHSYRLSHAALVAELGPLLFSEKPIPKVFSVTMGDHMYLLRHPALETLRRAIALVHAR